MTNPHSISAEPAASGVPPVSPFEPVVISVIQLRPYQFEAAIVSPRTGFLYRAVSGRDRERVLAVARDYAARAGLSVISVVGL